MQKTKCIFLFFVLSVTVCFAQKEKKATDTKALDSVQKTLDDQGIRIMQDSVFVEKKKTNPLAPSKAAFYSAILPGLGQIYNKRYWKVPIVYAAIGTGVYAFITNNNNLNTVRDAFKSRLAGFTNDEFFDLDPDDGITPTTPALDNGDLQDAQEDFQRDRDLSLLITIGLYALNIIDANVDAHLKQFNIDNDLSINYSPYLEYNPITATPNYGMALTIKF